MTQKPLLAVLMALMGTGVTLADTKASLKTNPIYGTVLASDEWNAEAGEQCYGIYSFDGENVEAIVTDYYIAAMGGGTYVNGLYCYNFNFSFMGSMAQNLYLMYDFEHDTLEGWELYETSYSDVATQVAYDITSGKVYGQFYNRDRTGRVWGTRDIEYGETDPIRPMEGNDLRALAFDNLGRAWAVDAVGDLLQIDKQTGQYIIVGNTGLQLAQTSQQSGAIDPASGIFYMIAVATDNTSALYTIDLATGMSTKVTDMPANEQFTGAYFMPLTYAANVPGAPTEMTLNFDRDALAGTVSCVAPAITEDGNVLTEGALLTLTLDGEKVGEVQTTPGQMVSFDVQAENSGTHVFQIIASNANGAGRPITLHQWIGLDVPVAVGNLTCTSIDNTHAQLSWTAPAEGLHRGYIDPEHLHYSVTDSEGTLVADNLTETQCEVSKSGSRLTARTFTVTAYTDDVAGLSAESNRIYFGTRYKVPYSTYFDTQSEYDLWYVVDANDDGSTWSYDDYNRFAHYVYNKYSAADDWLFSPPIRMVKEQYYDLQSNVSSRMTYYRERFEIMVCNAQHPDSVVAIVRTPTETEKNDKESRGFYTYDDYFCVPADGEYYLAYHCISDANQLDFEVRNVELTLGSSFDAPAAADNAVFRPGNMGSSSGSVEFDAPTKTIRGNELTSLTKAELYNGGYLCATLDHIEPGLHYTITDGDAQHGYNDYRLVIYNEHGKGLPVTGTVYVGHDIAAAPQNVQIRLDGDDIVISWDPVTIGKHGGYVDPDKILYVVVRQQDIEVVYEGYETSCIDNSISNRGAQESYFYGVFAYYGTDPSEGTATSDVVMGTPYTIPFEETFASDSGQSTLWLIGYDPYRTSGSWSVGDYPSYDGKPGNLTLSSYYQDGGYHFVSSGKIGIKSPAQHPVLTFAYKCAGMDDKIDVVISTQGVPNQGDTVATVRPTTLADWDVAHVDLSAYKNQNIIITWHCYLAELGDLVLDDVCVFDDPDANIGQIENDSATGTMPSYDLQGRRTQPGKADSFVIVPSGKRLIINKK